MKRIRQVLSLICLMAILLNVFAAGVSAADGSPTGQGVIQRAEFSMTTGDEGIQPYFHNTLDVIAAFSNKGAIATCSGEAQMQYDDLEFSYTLSIQRSKDQDTWTTAKVLASGKATGKVLLAKSYYMSSGYYYRTVMQVSSYRDGIEEVVAADSGGENYY